MERHALVQFQATVAWFLRNVSLTCIAVARQALRYVHTSGTGDFAVLKRCQLVQSVA